MSLIIIVHPFHGVSLSKILPETILLLRFNFHFPFGIWWGVCCPCFGETRHSESRFWTRLALTRLRIFAPLSIAGPFCYTSRNGKLPGCLVVRGDSCPAIC